MKISDYVSYEEATASITAQQLGLDNTPPPGALKCMKDTAVNIFDRVRAHFNAPLGVNSFYRSPALNSRVGGAKDSQHVKGQAVDIDGQTYRRVSNRDIFNYIRENLIFDQLIWEFGNDQEPDWVHVSYNAGNNRQQCLKSVRQDGKTVYLPVI